MATDETKILFALLGCALATGIFIINFFLSKLRQRRLHAKVHRTNTEVEIMVSERERNRIANDLHDDVAPILTAIKMQLEVLKSSIPEGEEEIQRTKRLLAEAIQKLRDVSNNLLPQGLANYGLNDVIKSFADDIESAGRLKIFLDFDEVMQIQDGQAIHIYRIVQEAIHNCLQHANASMVHLRIKQRKHTLELEIKDNGIGFNLLKMKEKEYGLGLRSIANRVEILRGDLYIDTKPGKGVRYFILIPLNASNE